MPIRVESITPQTHINQEYAYSQYVSELTKKLKEIEKNEKEDNKTLHNTYLAKKKAIDDVLYKQGAKRDYMCSCPRCGVMHLASNMYIISGINYYYVCESCYLQDPICYRCGQRYEGGNCICNRLQERKIMMANNIMVDDYDIKPPLYTLFYKDKKDRFFFGLEFEVEIDLSLKTNAKVINNLSKKPWIMLKRDGSVQKGIEIVTQPLSWEWILANLEELDDIFVLSKCTRVTASDNDTCGFHVHMNKSSFLSDGELNKFILFLYNELELVHTVSDREWNNFIRWASISDNFNRNSPDRLLEQARKIATIKHGNERHAMLNFMNKDSLEIRFFKGTLSRFQMFKNIEFILSVIEYLSGVSLKSIERDILEKRRDGTDNYINFLTTKKNIYPHIYEFLIGKGSNVHSSL